MMLAAFLRGDSAIHVARTVPDGDLLLAKSWQEFDVLLGMHKASLAVLDPSVSGRVDLEPIMKLMRKYPSIPFLAYVAPTEQNLKAVAVLSRHGLSDAIVHPADERGFCKTLEIYSRTILIRELLGILEIALGSLSESVLLAVKDLFERPHRYETGADIAVSAGIPIKRVYREFQEADLGTPKKLVTIAKLLYGHTLLKDSRLSITEICLKLGYSCPRTFAEHSGIVFGCPPSSLRGANDGEIIKSLLEWFYKPGRKSVGRRTLRSASG